MLEERFPQLLPLLAVGLTGSGSECFGYDDALSRDHDFDPGFCIFLPGEDRVDRRSAFLLERAYSKLPREFEGVSRALMQPAGGARRGVFRYPDFYMEKTGSPDGVLTPAQWLSLPDSALCEAVNGEIFFDGPGEVTAVRRRLSDRPEDVRRKKLAGSLLMMGQAGQYNYARCLAHGERAAAQLSAVRFAEHAVHAVFLLNRTYEPYYKWCFRALRALPLLSGLSDALEFLITTDNDGAMARTKQEIIEDIAGAVIGELRAQGLTRADCRDLEKHAYSVQDGIADLAIRNLHVLAAV